MEFKEIQLTQTDFISSNWQEFIEQCDSRKCDNYCHVFAQKIEEAQNSGDATQEEIFRLLYAISSFYLDLNNRAEPFGPKLRLFREGKRSAIPDDIPEIHWDALKEIVGNIRDAEMRARIADLLWLRRCDYKYAELAVSAYLESARILENPEHWTCCADRLERGLQVACELGKRTQSYAIIIKRLEELLLHYRGLENSFFPAQLMEMLLTQKQGKASIGIEISENLANKAAAANNWAMARRYLELAAAWYTMDESNEEARKTKIKAAETYVKEAELATKRSYLAASSHIKYAIEAMRRIGNLPDRIKELHEQLLKYQSESIDEMQQMSFSPDTSELERKAKEYIKGRTFPEVLFALVLMGGPHKRDTIEDQIKNLAKQAPLQFLIAEQILAPNGKVIAHRPGGLENDQAVLEAQTYKYLSHNQKIHIDCTIESARIQINEEHGISVRDIMHLISDSPFVPPGRKWIFARGIHAGLKGDFLMAAHLLVPQVENSVRYVLSQAGVITSGIDSEMIQEDYDLNRTLRMKEAEGVFGEDLIFDLRGLLVERFGSNLRNRIAHGLMHIGEFYTQQCAYLWWTTLRLCLLPIMNANSANHNNIESK